VADELSGAQTKLRQGDRDGALASIERALFLGIENATGIKARAVLRDQLTSTLVQAGLKAELASRVAPLLTQLEAARFTQQGDVDALVTTARTLVQSLPHRKAKSPGGTP